MHAVPCESARPAVSAELACPCAAAGILFTRPTMVGGKMEQHRHASFLSGACMEPADPYHDGPQPRIFDRPNINPSVHCPLVGPESPVPPPWLYRCSCYIPPVRLLLFQKKTKSVCSARPQNLSTCGSSKNGSSARLCARSFHNVSSFPEKKQKRKLCEALWSGLKLS
jgi:hypothetical protein